jgi:NAD(P)H dehydrogenase (quinone)
MTDKTMKISVIPAQPDKKSFNYAIAETVQDLLMNNRHEVYFHDLYEENFNPLLLADEIPKECLLTSEIELHCAACQIVVEREK